MIYLLRRVLLPVSSLFIRVGYDDAFSSYWHFRIWSLDYIFADSYALGCDGILKCYLMRLKISRRISLAHGHHASLSFYKCLDEYIVITARSRLRSCHFTFTSTVNYFSRYIYTRGNWYCELDGSSNRQKATTAYHFHDDAIMSSMFRLPPRDTSRCCFAEVSTIKWDVRWLRKRAIWALPLFYLNTIMSRAFSER